MNYRIPCILTTLIFSTQMLLPAQSEGKMPRMASKRTALLPKKASSFACTSKTCSMMAVGCSVITFAWVGSLVCLTKLGVISLGSKSAPTLLSPSCQRHYEYRLQAYADICDKGTCTRAFHVRELCEPAASDITSFKEILTTACQSSQEITLAHDIISLCARNTLPPCMPLEQALQKVKVTCRSGQQKNIPSSFNVPEEALEEPFKQHTTLLTPRQRFALRYEKLKSNRTRGH